MSTYRFRKRTGPWRWGVAWLAFALAFTQGVAIANVDEDNQLRGDMRLNPPAVGFYDYQVGSAASWTTQSDFDSAGSHSGTSAQDVADTLTLARIGPPSVTAPDPAKPWWDEDWETRTCFDISHPSGSDVFEYQLKFNFNLQNLVNDGVLQPDFGDLRAVSENGTLLPVWTETASTIWVQMDEIIAGSPTWFCFYYNHAPGPQTAPPNHTEAAVFTYAQFRDVYYAVSDRWSTAGSPVDVVSYTAGNEVQRDGGTTVALASPGSRDTFGAGGTGENSVFAVKGPISSQGSRNGFDTLVPISFAGRTFVVPSERGTNRFSIYAPFGATDVTIDDGTTQIASFTVPANTSYTHGSGDITGTNAAIIRADRPVLIVHRAGAGDVMPVYPATSAALYGIRSTRTRAASLADGSITITDSAGVANTYPVTTGLTVVENGGSNGGTGADAVRVNGTEPLGAIQQRDGDGNESTAYLPASELNTEYWIPGTHQYVATACIGGTNTITLTPPGGGSRTFGCNGSPGKGLDSVNTAVGGGTGTRLQSDGSAFYAFYEFTPRNDEHMLLGMKQGRQYTWPTPTIGSVSAPQGLYEASGVWTSDDIDTGTAGSGVFGEIDFSGLDPAQGTLEIRVATSATPGPTTFVGPDGLTTSYWTIGDLPSVLDFDHDAERYLAVEIRMTTSERVLTSPQVEAVTVDYNLQLLDRDAGSAGTLAVVNPTASPMTSYLLRVRTDPGGVVGTSTLDVLAADITNLASGALRFYNLATGLDSTQWTDAGPSPTPIAFDPASPHSIVLDHHKIAGPPVTIDMRWQLNIAGPGSIFIESDIDTEVTDS